MDPLTSFRAVRPMMAALEPAALAARAPRGIPAGELAPLGEAQRVRGPFPVTEIPGVSGVRESAPVSFADTLGQMVREVNQKQQISRDTVAGLLGGQKVPLHQAMIAMEEASVSFQLMVEVRNKLLESYQELMRMQV